MNHRQRSQKRARVRRSLFFEHLDARLLLSASDVSRVPFWDGETTDPAGPLINRMGGPVVDRAGGATVSHEIGVVQAGRGAFRVTTNGILPAHSFDFFGLALTGFGPSSEYADTRDLTGFEGVEFWMRNETGSPFNLVFEIKDYRDSNDHRARFTSAVSATAAWTPISMPLVLDAVHGWQVFGSPDLARTKLFALVIETGTQAINGSFFIDDMVLIEKGGSLNPATADGNALVDRVMWRGFRGLWGSRDVDTGLIPNNSAQADVMALNSTAALIAMLPTAVQQGELAAADADEYVSTVVDTLNTVWNNIEATGNGGFVPPRYVDRVTLAPTNLQEESSVDAALLFLPLYAYWASPSTPTALQTKIESLLERFDFAAFSSPAGWTMAYRYADAAFTTGTYDGYSTEVYVISLAAHLAPNHRVDITTHWNSADLRVLDYLVDPAESHVVHTSPEFRPPFSQWLFSLLVDVRDRGADTYQTANLAGNPYWNAVKYQREVQRKLEELGRPTFVQPDAGDNGSGAKYEQYSLYADYGEPDLLMPWSVGSAFLATQDFALEALRDILQRDFHGPLGLSDSVHIATGAAMPTALAARTDFWNQSLVTLALMEYRHGSNEFLTALPEVRAALDKVLPPAAPFGSMPEALTTSRNWIAFTPRNYNPNVGQFPTEAQLRADLQQLYDDGWRGIVTYTLDGTLRHVPRLAKQIGFTKVIGGIYWYDDAQLAREKAAVPEVDPFVDAYVVGNEGLFAGRYTRAALERETAAIKLLTGKPVATTETGGQYLADPTLLDVGDWVFPNIQPFCPQPAIRSVADAVAHTANEFLAIRAAAVARAPDRVVALKETWWPTADDAAATQANQAEYFGQLAQTETVFVWGESFDQPWKFEPGCYNQGSFWGLYTADGEFKAAIPQLHTVYVSGQAVPPDSDGDGISDAVEDDAPNQGDGNGDQIPDRLQSNVVSLPNAVDGRYLTLAVAAPTVFTDVRAVGNPSSGDAPEGIDFRAGFVDFVVTGAGASVTVEVFLDQTAGVNTFYRFGQTEAGQVPHWYRYLSKGGAGAEILADRIRLRLVDGGRGDDDLLVNGTISARGAPAADLRLHPWQNPQEPLDVNDDGHIEPLDVLVLINDINAKQSRALTVPPAPPDVAYYFLDPNGDDRLTPIDVLVVINNLNAQAASTAAEGEADAWYPGWLFPAGAETARDSFFTEFGRASRDGDCQAISVDIAASSLAVAARRDVAVSPFDTRTERNRSQAERYPGSDVAYVSGLIDAPFHCDGLEFKASSRRCPGSSPPDRQARFC